MESLVVEIGARKGRILNAISLQNAVLCADCDNLSDSPHDQCLVCGSRSLFNISRVLGGMLPSQRAKLVDVATASVMAPVLTFRRPLGMLRAVDREPIESDALANESLTGSSS
jgi:hypothetical protein